MSKTSSRMKRKEQQKKQEQRLTAPILTQQGLQAFNLGDYRKAVNLWQLAQRKAEAPKTLSAAMAEAYFRWALATPDTSSVAHLQEALKLAPTEPRYHYHLALAYHRQHNLAEAEPIYRQLLSQTPPYPRAALPLAQLLLAQKKPLLKDPVWKLLSMDEQQQLAVADALIKQKARSTLEKFLELPTLNPLWQGLLAFALKQPEVAQPKLAEAAQSEQGGVRAVAHYYGGLLSLEQGQVAQALSEWQAAQAEGFNSKLFPYNLSSFYYQQAVQALKSGLPQQALAYFQQVVELDFVVNYAQFKRQLLWSAGYAAAQQGQWAEALERWETVLKLGDDSRKLLFNVALAYQKNDRHLEAAQSWRELLRRRPRKADHEDALSQEQVARIWQTAAEQFSQAGDDEEAIKTYKNAIKWQPSNIELRIKLVETYQTNGRWQAATNELNRILVEKPDYVPALLLLAESHSEDNLGPHAGKSVALLERVLELEPQNMMARQQLAAYYEQQGQFRIHWWGDLKQAMEFFEKGLSYVPENVNLRLHIGICQAQLKQFDQAKATFEQLLASAPQNLNAFVNIYNTWLRHKRKVELAELIERMKLLTHAPGAFFVELIEKALEFENKAVAEDLMAFVEEKYAQDDQAMMDLAMCYSGSNREAQGVNLLRQILERNPAHIEAQIRLGVLYYEMKQTRLAKRHWDLAEAEAKRQNNQMMLYEIKTTRDHYLHGRRAPQNIFDFVTQMPPGLLDELLKNAPPHIAKMIKNNPEMLKTLLGDMAGLNEGDIYG